MTTDHASSEALRTELRRVNEAYTLAVRELRAHKQATDSREQELVAEAQKWRNQASNYEKMRREHADMSAGLRTTREKLEAAVATNSTLRDRLDERTKARDRSVATVSELQAQISHYSNELERLRSSSSSAETARNASAGLAEAHKTLLAEATVLRQEKEALLDAVDELQSQLRKFAEDSLRGQAAGVDLRAALGSLEDCNKRLLVAEDAARQTQTLEAELAQRNSDAKMLRERLTSAEATTHELEAVQKELLATISTQAGQLREVSQAHRAAAVDQGALSDKCAMETRTVERLERIVSNYQRLEKEFVRRTGQGFWGLFGLAGSLGLHDEVPGTAHTSTVASDRAFEDAVKRFKESYKEELSTQLTAERANELVAISSNARALEAELGRTRAALHDVQAANTQLERKIGDILNVESQIRALLLSGNSSGSPAHSNARTLTTGGAQGHSTVAEALTSEEWHLLPGLTALFPNFASAVGILRHSLSECQRHRRLAESEVQDLRDEVRMLRDTKDTEAAGRSIATQELREAARLSQGDKERALNELSRQTFKVEKLESELSLQCERVLRYKTRVTKAKEYIQSMRDVRIQLETALSAKDSELSHLALTVASSKQLLSDAKEMNAQLLEIVKERDSLIATLRLHSAQAAYSAVHATSSIGATIARSGMGGVESGMAGGHDYSPLTLEPPLHTARSHAPIVATSVSSHKAVEVPYLSIHSSSSQMEPQGGGKGKSHSTSSTARHPSHVTATVCPQAGPGYPHTSPTLLLPSAVTRGAGAGASRADTTRRGEALAATIAMREEPIAQTGRGSGSGRGVSGDASAGRYTGRHMDAALATATPFNEFLVSSPSTDSFLDTQMEVSPPSRATLGTLQRAEAAASRPQDKDAPGDEMKSPDWRRDMSLDALGLGLWDSSVTLGLTNTTMSSIGEVAAASNHRGQALVHRSTPLQHRTGSGDGRGTSTGSDSGQGQDAPVAAEHTTTAGPSGKKKHEPVVARKARGGAQAAATTGSKR